MKKLLLLIAVLASTAFAKAEDTKAPFDPDKRTDLTINQFDCMQGTRDQTHSSGGFGYYFGEKPHLEISFTNTTDSVFEGTLAIILTATKRGSEANILIETDVFETLLTRQITLNIGETYSESIHLEKGLPQSAYREELAFYPHYHHMTPIVKEKGSDIWTAFEGDYNLPKQVNFNLYNGENVFFMTDDISCPNTAKQGEIFDVAVPIYSSSQGITQDSIQIGLFRSEISGTTGFTFIYYLVERIDTEINGNVYTCKIPDDMEPGDYILYPTVKGSPTSFVESKIHFSPNNTLGSYRPMGTTGNPYESDGSISITDQSSGIDNNQMDAVRLSPNPVKDILFIEQDTDNKHNVEVYNSIGKLVLSADSNATQLDVASLTNGIYFVKIGNKAHKMVKQ